MNDDTERLEHLRRMENEQLRRTGEADPRPPVSEEAVDLGLTNERIDRFLAKLQREYGRHHHPHLRVVPNERSA